MGAPHYAEPGELGAPARCDAAPPPPGPARRRGPGGRLRGERRPGDQRLPGAGHRRGQPGWLDRAPGRGGRADRGLLLHGGRRVPLHDRPARTDGARARGGAAVAAATAPRGRRPSCGACTCAGASTRRWPPTWSTRSCRTPISRSRRTPARSSGSRHRAWGRRGRRPPPRSSPSPWGRSSPWRRGSSRRGRRPSCCPSSWARWPRSSWASCWPATPSGRVLVSALRQLAVTVVAAGVTFGVGRAIGTGVS